MYQKRLSDWRVAFLTAGFTIWVGTSSANCQGAIMCPLRCPVQTEETVDEKRTADFAMPATSLFYLELSDPAAAVDLVLNHELTTEILQLEQVQQGLKSPQGAVVKILVGALEEQLQMTWPQIIGTFSKHGLAVAWDAESKGVILISRSTDGESLSKIVKAILGWVNLDARLNRRDKPYEAEDYRSHRILKFPQGAIARVNDCFLAANNLRLLRETMDRLIDQSEKESGNLAATIPFQQAREKQPAEGIAWTFFNLQEIQKVGIAKELFQGQTDQPVVELLLGGLLESLREAQYASANLQLSTTEAIVQVSLPRKLDYVSMHRQFFFAADPEAKTSFFIEAENMVGRIVGRRDLAAWWLSKENLFDENVIAQMALADSQFSTILSGMNFGEDFLSAFEPCLQLIVADQKNDSAEISIKLPSFAIVGRLKDPEEMKRPMRIAFNSAVGIANIQGTMVGMPALDFMTEKQDGIEITAASYVMNRRTVDAQPPLDISPAIAFADDFMIISSTRELALELGKNCLHRTCELDPAHNLSAEINIPLLTKVLEKNREPLIAQNMLEQGNKRERAEQEIAQLFQILRLFDKFDSRIEIHPKEMNATLNVQFKLNSKTK